MARHKEYLSPFEWEIINAIWEIGGKPTVKNVHEKLYPDGEKAYNTVQTIMNILVDRGFLRKEKFGPVNLYIPLIKRKEAVMKETDIFIDKIFNGSFQKMASFMVDSRNLSESDIAYLKDLIRKKEKEQGGE